MSKFVFVNFIALVLSAGAMANSNPQESAGVLGNYHGADANVKLLTSGEVDTWAFHAERNEVLIVRVTTNEFDSVVGLAKVGKNEGEDDEVLFSNDDNGSNSRFRYRIKNAGTYKIRVHAYKMKGGGNYELSVVRHQATPLEIGKVAKTDSDEDGNASFFFKAEPGQYVSLIGSNRLLLDPKGDVVRSEWGNDVYLIRKEGEYLAVCSTGVADSKFSFEVRPAVVSELKVGDEKNYDSPSGTLHSWEIKGQRGQFALVTVSRSKNPDSRIVFAPRKDPNEKELDTQRHRGPELRFLPVASKGESTTYAVVFGRNGKFLLQTKAHRNCKIRITMKDPTIDLTSDPELVKHLDVGNAAWFGFDATAGDLVKFDLGSDSFDSVLRLFDGGGRLIRENDDFEDSTDSQITYLVQKSGYFRWQVSSLGNGGGGEYKVNFIEIPKTKIAVGDVKTSEVEGGRTDYWLLEGEPDAPVYLNARSRSFNLDLKAYDSRGRQVSSDVDVSGYESLISFNLGSDGKATLWVSSQSKGGRYDIRVIDAGWKNVSKD